jgi:16S rRNA processing protein RimM
LTTDKYYKAGKIMKVHGVKGELSISLYEPELFGNYTFEMLFINPGGGPVPFFISTFSFNQNKNLLIVQLEDITDPGAASAFVQKEVFLSSDALPAPDEKKFFSHEVIGFKVIDIQAGDIGIIAEILDLPMQQVFRILKDKIEILVPAVNDIIIEINREAQTVKINAPEGLIDLYLNEGHEDEEE